jgi:Flp pilus assembly protein TadD
MNTRPRPFQCLLAGFLLAEFTVCAAAVFARPRDSQEASGDLLRQGQQKVREGQSEEAMALYRRVLQNAPRSFEANRLAGVVLDLMGQYADGRTYLAKAIEVASSPQQKARAQRSMAISYAFEHDCRGAAKYEVAVYQTYVDAKEFSQAGEIANELAGVCLEAGELDVAYTWYHTGHEIALREPDLEPARKDLCNFRWEDAQVRIMARRGAYAEAQRHVDAARALFDGGDFQQPALLRSLIGYVAFYAGDFPTALSKLKEANQRDPSILCLIAQTYEKLGDTVHAMDYYRRALAASDAHNATAAAARPLARKKLGSRADEIAATTCLVPESLEA